MDVQVFQAFLTIENKTVKLTKAIAKQFPMAPLGTRECDAGLAREPICKVQGKTLGHVATWLYLVEDEEAGLAWEPAPLYHEAHAKTMRERGFNVDNPSEVPTVIL